MATTADQILQEIRAFPTVDGLLDDVAISDTFKNAQAHARGIRDAHVREALQDPGLQVERWDLGNDTTIGVAVAPATGPRPDAFLLLVASNRSMPLSIVTGWRLHGDWSGTTPAELFAEFVARYGRALTIRGRSPELFTGRAEVPGQSDTTLIDAGDLGHHGTAHAIVRGDPQTGNQVLAWVFSIRTDEYERSLRTH